MRRDLWDMNPGKAMAQAAHAQAEFDAYVEDRCGPRYLQDDPLWSAVRTWRNDRSFGTTLVLHETLDTISKISMNVRYWGYVTDPTYPYRNYYGEVFTRLEITCMWAFVYADEEVEYMRQFGLHK
jgi:hypothetical protein